MTDPDGIAPLPGTVWVAAGLAGLSAVVGLFFPPVGWLCTVVYGVGLIGLIGSRPWGYWTLVIASGIGVLSTLMSGRIFIGTTLLILVMLLTPSARAAFGLGSSVAAND